MQIIKETKNKNFDQALKFVQETYSYLFHDRLQSITLELPNSKNKHYLGLHWNFNDESRIKIKAGRYRTVDFIETLVHELVHVWQYSKDRTDCKDQMEREANSISHLAYKTYLEKTGEPFWS